MCVIVHIESYISLTQSLKETTASLFTSDCKPYKPVSKDTISRWVKHLMQELTLKPVQSTALEQLHYQKYVSFVYQWNRSLLQHPGPMQKHLPSFYNKPIETTQTSFGNELLDNVFKNDTSV